MDKTRRAFVVFGGAAMVAGLTGCFTSMLLEEKKGRYSEEVSSVLLTRDGGKLVVIGGRYHYIFDAPEVIRLTLVSPFRKKVRGAFDEFTLDGSGAIGGECVLSLSGPLTTREQQEALSAGYQQRGDGSLIYRAQLKGKRYLAGEQKLVAEQYRLNRSYRVDIRWAESSAEKAGKLLLTPLTVAADGALFLAAVPLIAVVFIASEGKIMDLR